MSCLSPKLILGHQSACKDICGCWCFAPMNLYGKNRMHLPDPFRMHPNPNYNYPMCCKPSTSTSKRQYTVYHIICSTSILCNNLRCPFLMGILSLLSNHLQPIGNQCKSYNKNMPQPLVKPRTQRTDCNGLRLLHWAFCYACIITSMGWSVQKLLWCVLHVWFAWSNCCRNISCSSNSSTWNAQNTCKIMQDWTFDRTGNTRHKHNLLGESSSPCCAHRRQLACQSSCEYQRTRSSLTAHKQNKPSYLQFTAQGLKVLKASATCLRKRYQRMPSQCRNRWKQQMLFFFLCHVCWALSSFLCHHPGTQQA